MADSSRQIGKELLTSSVVGKTQYFSNEGGYVYLISFDYHKGFLYRILIIN